MCAAWAEIYPQHNSCIYGYKSIMGKGVGRLWKPEAQKVCYEITSPRNVRHSITLKSYHHECQNKNWKMTATRSILIQKADNLQALRTKQRTTDNWGILREEERFFSREKNPDSFSNNNQWTMTYK